MRRQSKISLATIHRNPFPLKLDLSSAALRLNLDEVNLSGLGNLSSIGGINPLTGMGLSGLPSPVTLAPKSARPMAQGELPAELLTAFHQDPHVDIDLTLDDATQAASSIMDATNAMGASADKPIELDLDLDLDMPDLFGDPPGDQQTQSHTDMDNIFQSHSSSGAGLNLGGSVSNMEILNALSAAGDQQQAVDLLGSFSEGLEGANTHPTIAQDTMVLPDSSAILAGLTDASDDISKLQAESSIAGSTGENNVSTSFDYTNLNIDDVVPMPASLSSFFPPNQDMDIMEQLMNIDKIKQ